jgi:hypothetical protein
MNYLTNFLSVNQFYQTRNSNNKIIMEPTAIKRPTEEAFRKFIKKFARFIVEEAANGTLCCLSIYCSIVYCKDGEYVVEREKENEN